MVLNIMGYISVINSDYKVRGTGFVSSYLYLSKLGMSEFLEFNTRVLGTDTREYSSTGKTPQHSEEINDPRL